MKRSAFLAIAVAVRAALIGAATSAQAAEEEKDPAAKAALDLRNPVATLVSIHLQNDLDFGYGEAKATAFTASLIPVVPFPLGTNWNLITRTLVAAVADWATSWRRYIYPPNSRCMVGTGARGQA